MVVLESLRSFSDDHQITNTHEIHDQDSDTTEADSLSIKSSEHTEDTSSDGNSAEATDSTSTDGDVVPDGKYLFEAITVILSDTD